MRKITKILLATTCITGLAAPALAQDNAPDDAAADNAGGTPASPAGSIVVTGSRINRPNATAAAPITSVTNDAIRAQAAVNIEEVLNRIPQISPDSQQNYQDSDGRQRIKLRNLGFERTLTLIDGKRVGTMNGVDANMIPTSLIKRVDVLTGGASAVYGSDAIAGVVNFVMDDDFEGLQVNGNYNFYAHSNKRTLISDVASQYGFQQPASGTTTDGGRTDVSVTFGKKLFDNRFHISGYVNYREAALVPFSSRETSGCQLVESSKDGPLGCTVSTYTPNGYISPRTGAANGEEYVNNPDGSRTFVPYSDAVAANPYDGESFQRADKRWNAGGFTSFEISDAAELYGSVMWFRDRSTNPFPARVYSPTAYGDGSSPYYVNCNNPLMSASQAQTVCGAAAGTSELVPIELRYRLNNVAPLDDVYVNTGLRATAGVRGQFAQGWNYDLGGVYARNRQDITWGQPDYDRVNNALNVVNVNGQLQCASGSADGCLPFDAFSANSAMNTQSLYNYLISGNFGTSTTINSLYNVVGTVQGDLGTYGIKTPWAEQGVAVAFGAEFREDKLQSYADDIWREQNGGSDSNLSQHAWEGNVELQVPIAEHKPFADLIQFNGAYRLSKYSSNPSVFSTWKAEAIWAPIPDITFRGSINRAQRAPTVVEAYQGSNISYGRIDTAYNDICAPTVSYTTGANGQRVPVYGAPAASREVCKATGLADNLYGSPTLICPTDIGCTVRHGGYTVDPETAYTKTFGVVLKPSFIRGLTVSVDRFLIDLNDSIGYNDYDYFSNGCLQTGSEFFCSMFVRNADGTLSSNPNTNPDTGYIRGGTTNYYKSKSHGWDFQGQYNLGFGKYGSVAFDFSGSLTTLAGGQDSPILAKYNCAGYFGGPCGQLIPKWTHSLRATYTTEDRVFNASFNWRYVGPLTNVSNSGDPALGWSESTERETFYRIGAQNYFDLALTVRVNEQFSLRMSANNIFDKLPPLIPNSYSYALSRSNTLSARYDSLGRQLAIGATVNF
ncbi:TonB-dependent receptor [Novosphingobium sp. PhB165]|uniref:TonB-dependent receptor domain-containing protein n=1 Tax=Novosphingobium sp. PhB165 TaxID=2485105 RepID=UPI001FB38E74|nr:TonB-dependent receptor [Novosphingobium sp. PhB165]